MLNAARTIAIFAGIIALFTFAGYTFGPGAMALLFWTGVIILLFVRRNRKATR